MARTMRLWRSFSFLILTLAGTAAMAVPAMSQMTVMERSSVSHHVDPRWGIELRLPRPNTLCELFDLTVYQAFAVLEEGARCWNSDGSMRSLDDKIVLSLDFGFEPSADPVAMEIDFEDLGYVPPIRREIARRWCARAAPRIEAKFRELGRVAGRPAFECRGLLWRDERHVGSRIAVTLFRGSQPTGEPPYPKYRYVLSIASPPGQEEKAESLMREILSEVRLLPKR